MGGTFNRYLGIDYSGAETADSSCKGIRVFMAEGSGEPKQIQPPPSPRRYWTRRGLAEWLREELDRDIPTIVGIDHAFSFPLAYFERYRLPGDWQGFLEDFHHHWPTDAPQTYVCFLREPSGSGLKRTGERSWLRVTETWTVTAKSVFFFLGGSGRGELLLLGKNQRRECIAIERVEIGQRIADMRRVCQECSPTASTKCVEIRWNPAGSSDRGRRRPRAFRPSPVDALQQHR